MATLAEIIATAHASAPHGRVRISYSVIAGQAPSVFEAAIIEVVGDTVTYTTDGVWKSDATRGRFTSWEVISAPAPTAETSRSDERSDGPHDVARVSRFYAPTGYAYTRAEVEAAASAALGREAVALRRIGDWAYCAVAAPAEPTPEPLPDWELALMAPAPEPVPWESSGPGVDPDSVAGRVAAQREREVQRAYATAALLDDERAPEPSGPVVVSLNAAGCLPDADPLTFDTFPEAWAYVAEEVERIDDDGDYLAAHTALHRQDRNAPGSIPAGENTTYAYNVEAGL